MRFELVLCLAVVLLATNGVRAAPDPSAYTIVRVPTEALKTPVFDQGTAAESMRSLTATVEGRVCAGIKLVGPSDTDSDGNKVLTLGTGEQPWHCRQATGSIVFIDGTGKQLATELALAPGSSPVLSNLAPRPPGFVRPLGFLRASLRLAGRPVLGDGRTIPGGSLLVLPAAVDQPVDFRSTPPHLYPIEENGVLRFALPAGDYLVTYSFTDVRLVDTDAAIRISTPFASTGVLTFPAVTLRIEPDNVTRLLLEAIDDPLVPPPPFISEPRP